MKTRSGSTLSVSRKTTSSSVSNQHTRTGRTTNKDVQGIKKLDTNIFESYIRIVWNKIPEEKRLSCTCADSMWFHMYLHKHYRQKVLRAMSRTKIFTNRYVFIPICQFNHWNLMILCNLGEDINSERKSPCILLLDSLLEFTGGDFETEVRRFLLDLYANEKREESEDSIYRIPFKVPNVPQQQDGIRCGYYVLYFIYRFLMCCPDEFNISEHYPGFLKEDWFRRNEIDSFCENLLSLDSESGTCNNTRSELRASESEVEIIDDSNTGTQGVEGGYPVKVDNGDETEIDKDDDEKQEQKDTGNELEKYDVNKGPKTKLEEERPVLVLHLAKSSEEEVSLQKESHNTDGSEAHAADNEGYCKTDKESLRDSVLSQSRTFVQISNKNTTKKFVGSIRSIPTTARRSPRLVRHNVQPEGDCNIKCNPPIVQNKKSSKNFSTKRRDENTIQKPRRICNTSPSSDSDLLEPPLKRCAEKECRNNAKKDVLASSDINGSLLDESTSKPTKEPTQRDISTSSSISIYVDFTQYGPLPFRRRP